MQKQTVRLAVFAVVIAVSSCGGPPAPLPESDFYVDGNNCDAPCTIHFYDQSLNAISWNWTFGNGTSSVNQDDSALYATPGIYNVELEAWNDDGIMDSIIKQVTVY